MTPRSILPEVGQRLAAARLQRGLAQNEVAERAGIAPSYLSRVENGKVHPSFRAAMQIARALEAKPAEIFGLDTEPPSERGPCPVTRKGQCLLDLIGPAKGDTHYSAREVRLIRSFASWIQDAEPSRLRTMEVLLEDLKGPRDS